MNRSLVFPVLFGSLSLIFTSCQNTGTGDTADLPALDYPFDEQGNYIESKARSLGTGGRTSKPITLAQNTPPPPMPDVAPPPLPDNNYAPVDDVIPPPPNLAQNTQPRPSTGSGGGSNKTKSSTTKPKSSTSSGTKTTSSVAYTVVKGDTLSGIASRYGTSVSAIRSANGLSSSNLIRVGQKLKVPKGSGSVASRSNSSSSKPSSTSTSSSGGSYTVKSGDSLWVIARKNNTSVDKLMKANGLSSDKLKIGQTLKIP
ncbi:MAG: LysM peptidoglycan-binding domain-containing protein [Verrucomicrobiales bacterium]